MAIEKIGTGTQTLGGPQNYSTLTTTGGVTNVNGSFTSGTVTVNANATLNFGASQTLAALNIGGGVTVTLSEVTPPAPFAAAGADSSFGDVDPSATTAAVPEPGTVSLLIFGALGLLGRRRRIT